MVPNTSPAKKICRVENCGRTVAHKAKRLCKTHAEYDRIGKDLHAIVKPEEFCSISGCTRRRKARGWCHTHYTRFIRHGNPNSVGLIYGDNEKRFWSKVDKTPTCWVWTGSPHSAGYGTILIDGQIKYAHRVSYEMAYGRIPEGLEIDHICHNRPCVNPSHLRPVTRKQNMENLIGATRESSTGIRGVFWVSGINSYRVRVQHHNVGIHVGYFPSIQEAEAAAIAKRNELFTHNNYDRN